MFIINTCVTFCYIESEFTERVKAIALLDGENGLGRYSQLEDDGQWLREVREVLE
jgi:hypothetical protein